jgi:hypothetical protein
LQICHYNAILGCRTFSQKEKAAMANFNLKRLNRLFKDLFIGKKKLSPKEIWREKRRICAAAGILPQEIKKLLGRHRGIALENLH